MGKHRYQIVPRGQRFSNRLRTSVVALFCASLLAGLIPPPVVTGILPESAAELAETLLPEPSVAQAQAGISGAVFRDYNANGTRDSATGDVNTTPKFPEPGVSGLTVTAYPASGNGTSGAVTTTTANDGSFTLATTDAGAWRIEVTGLPDYLQPGAAGTSTVVFANDGDTNIEIGVNNPADYSQDDPTVASVAMSQGSATGSFSGNTGLFSVKRSTVGQSASAGTVTGNPTDGTMTVMSTFGEIGAAFGIAWNRTDNQLYTAAFHKNLVGYGPGGRGQIYRTAMNPVTGAATAAATQWVNVETDLGRTLCGAHGTDIDEPPVYEEPPFDQVGRCGLGDIDISYDDSTLYAVNIAPAEVLAISTADGTLADSWAIPTAGVTGCTGTSYPFALAVKDDQIYVGATCDSAPIFTVHQLDPATGSWSSLFSFNPNSEPSNTEAPRLGFQTEWVTRLEDSNLRANGYRDGEFGWLVDIEFFGDDMTLGIRDRMGDQWGHQVPDPLGNPGQLTNTGTAGDLFCAYFDTNTGTYVYPRREQNISGNNSGVRAGQTCGPNRATVDPNPSTMWFGGEFYWGDGTTTYYTTTIHDEQSSGALAQWGLDDLVLTELTPQNALGSTQFNSGGIGWINNVDGAPVHAYQVHGGGAGEFGKANGMGDLELLSLPAPIEIGNRVWHDADDDGLQDAGESPINGATVTLHDMDNGGATVGTATTAADGTYIFGGINDTNMTSGSVLTNNSYEVRISLSDAALPVNGVTITDANSISSNNNKTDLADNDASASGGNAVIAFTTGGAGENNHTLDFGFNAPVLGSIGDTIFSDVDGDPLTSAGEPDLAAGDLPLEGVLVTLTLPDSTTMTDTTDINGNYLFEDLPMGAYTIMVDTTTLPDAKENNPVYDPDGGADSVSTTTLTAAEPNDLDQDFSYVALGSIGDTIFSDVDGDPLTSAGEPDLAAGDLPLEGVLVTLTLPDSTTMTDTTDINGNYLFEDLPMGAYTIMVDTTTLPDAKENNPVYDPDGGADSVSTTTLTAAEPNDLDQDFSYVALGSIGDTIFSDVDGDPLTSAGEPDLAAGDLPLEGVLVTLTLPDSTTMTDTTDINGNYLFEDLPMGAYTIMVDTTTLPDAKENNLVYDPDGGADSVSTTTLTAAEPNDLDQDFSYVALGSIGDTIFSDVDGDPLTSAGEPDLAAGDLPLEGVLVTLTLPDSTTMTDTTDINGNYLFEDLPMGAYTIMVDTTTLPDAKENNPVYDPDGGADSVSTTTLTAAEPNDLDQDFSYVALGSIGDTIFSDVDGDPLTSAGEPDLAAGDLPLEGVLVTLTLPDSTTMTDTTDINGNYLFEDLPMGAYTIMVDTTTLPDAKENNLVYDPDGGADSVSTTTLTAAEPNDLDQDFSYVALGSIGDTIFSDVDGDPLTSAGEPDLAAGDLPLEGVLVTLTLPDSTTMTDTTDINGNYLFEDLPMGAYTIMVDTTTLPDAKENNPVYDPDGGADSVSTTTLTAAEPNDLDQDFSYVALGSIGDQVWSDDDNDGNGLVDGDDTPLAGVSVTLLDSSGAVLATKMTDADGFYLFDGLPLDVAYTVAVDLTTLPVAKQSNPAFDPEGDGDSTSTVTLTADDPATDKDEANDRDRDFAYFIPDEPLGSIGDQVWSDDDNDGNGLVDGDDTPLAGVSVMLLDSSGAVLATKMTDADGFYLFDGLPLDVAYTVAVDLTTLPVAKQSNPAFDPEGDGDSTSTVTLTVDDPATDKDEANDRDRDFAYFIPDEPLGSIGDQVWSDDDNDGNGLVDGDDTPLAGVSVTLLDSSGAVLATKMTDADGFYLFDGLPLDVAYTVAVDLTTLPVAKQSNPAFDPEGDGDSTSTVTLTADDPATDKDEANDRDRDFAYFIPDEPLGSIGDQVWSDDDNDGNGLVDGDDTPLAGVSVTLLDSSGAVLATKMTDADGFYLFDGLPLDVAYTVAVDLTTLPVAKQGNPAFDPEGDGDSTSTVTLTVDDPATDKDEANDRDRDFAYFIPDGPLGSIGDTIFHDANGNGVMEDGNDFPLPTVVVMLTDSSGNTVTTTTDINGHYLFENLLLGTYTVLVDTTTLPSGKLAVPSADPDGGADSTSTVSLTSAVPNNLDQDFGYEQDPVLASLGNYFWIDADNDGIFDPEEAPVIGAVVILYNISGGEVGTVLTDENGFFEFAVPAGDYYLDFVPPLGYSFTEPNAGDGYDSDADPRTGRTQIITLQSGTHDPSWGAGVILADPTAVNLSAFTADLRNGTELVIRWTTSAELDTFGFHILRSSTGTLADAHRLTNQLTPSQGSAGGRYEVVLPYDETVDPLLSLLSFWLYEVEVGGGIHTYGPATVDLDAAGMDQFMYLPFLSQ